MKIKLIFLVVFLFAGCASLATKNENGYPPKVVENIITGCEKTSAVPKICPCLAEKVQKKFSYEEFVKIEKAMEKGNTPEEFTEVAQESVKQCNIEMKK